MDQPHATALGTATTAEIEAIIAASNAEVREMAAVTATPKMAESREPRVIRFRGLDARDRDAEWADRAGYRWCFRAEQEGAAKSWQYWWQAAEQWMHAEPTASHAPWTEIAAHPQSAPEPKPVAAYAGVAYKDCVNDKMALWLKFGAKAERGDLPGAMETLKSIDENAHNEVLKIVCLIEDLLDIPGALTARLTSSSDSPSRPELRAHSPEGRTTSTDPVVEKIWRHLQGGETVPAPANPAAGAGTPLTQADLHSAAYAAREYAAACGTDFAIDYWTGIAEKLTTAAASA